MRVLTEVIEIDREQKLIRFRDVITGEMGEQPYDMVVLSPGARPMIPDIPGLNEATNLFTLRNIPDTDVIKAYVDEKHPRHATVIGGGFIGLEMAENLRERGLAITIIDQGEQLLNPLDPEMAKLVEQHMKLNGVEVRLKEVDCNVLVLFSRYMKPLRLWKKDKNWRLQQPILVLREILKHGASKPGIRWSLWECPMTRLRL
ncbi:oxidoreductase [Paenibacillus terrae HPL-003]|uniref:Oxidoreductase n=1 Tax=Paenibacillus terrae (strain HPL-003) TaxID=985665 RepID=G7VV30_PAETH|nr:oxidoreductase [Paenibacillus terrae HPL-003]